MSIQEIIALNAGPVLDRLVHEHVFEATGRAPAYSTDDAVAITILDRVPMFIASIDPGKPGYDEARPYVAGRLQHEASVKGDITILRVTAATLALALAKGALIALAKTGAVKTQAAPTMQDRINEAVQKRRPQPTPRRVKAGKSPKAAPEQVGGNGPAPVSPPAGQPAKHIPRPLRPQLPQPAAGLGRMAERPALPKRKPFIAGSTQQSAQKPTEE